MVTDGGRGKTSVDPHSSELCGITHKIFYLMHTKIPMNIITSSSDNQSSRISEVRISEGPPYLASPFLVSNQFVLFFFFKNLWACKAHHPISQWRISFSVVPCFDNLDIISSTWRSALSLVTDLRDCHWVHNVCMHICPDHTAQYKCIHVKPTNAYIVNSMTNMDRYNKTDYLITACLHIHVLGKWKVIRLHVYTHRYA